MPVGQVSKQVRKLIYSTYNRYLLHATPQTNVPSIDAQSAPNAMKVAASSTPVDWQQSMMPNGWKGDQRSDIALTVHHRLGGIRTR